MMTTTKKIWIDLDNSPHVPLFKPIIEELNKHGYPVMLTVRDCYQVCGLADLFNLTYTRIGRHYGKNKILKLVGVFFRALQMVPTVTSQRPNLALSHGSRPQLLLALILRIPSVMMDDYEHGKGFAFLYPTWVIVPDVIPDKAVKVYKKRVLRYPGIKEDAYVPNFEPDRTIKDELGLGGKELVVTVRPPATEAHYHNRQSEDLLKEAIDFLVRKQDVRIVLLPRNDKQAAFVRGTWPTLCINGKITIPEHVVDGLNLMWHSDLVISGGGTMNREAAALGVPVYSIFRGKIGAVDRYLSDSGRLTLIKNAEDVRKKIVLARRQRPAQPEHANGAALHKIVEGIVRILEG